ncbi:hypothetical protein B1992_08850 [Pseudoxanthomonas broegbernensis]|uniref:Uncharacterized protein n=1 Tax=Pseudoxanthomonas broegbernensis TaxID=83619 RepID=A0A7V8GM84_9GAMM|nr:hypothetical protein [Pseudoxanthomonas broegbernensis]KAF1686321.1 hypothetical protein B1992_08850 [Pseudoxanthomonas broegbernensis]MBB6064008.1 hypothetical protein [Pseudoxanthomonas broegbernensis]
MPHAEHVHSRCKPVAGLVLAATLLAGIGGVHASKPKTQRGAFGVAQQQVQTTGDKYFAGEDKVVVASFRVAFGQEVKASAQSSSLFGKSSASAAMHGTLSGLDNEVWQAITDAAHADFLEKLKAAGLTVLEARDVEYGAYGKLAGVSSPAALDADQGKLLMFAPTGAKLTMLPGDTGAGSAFSGFNASSAVQVWPAIIREQQAGVMSVTYYLDFLNADSSGKTQVLGGDAEVSMGQGLSVRAGSGIGYATLKGSQCKGYCPHANGSITLGQAVHSQQAYGRTEDVTKGGVNALGAVSGLLSGRGFSRKDLQIHADPERYRGISERLLGEANTALIDALRQARGD